MTHVILDGLFGPLAIQPGFIVSMETLNMDLAFYHDTKAEAENDAARQIDPTAAERPSPGPWTRFLMSKGARSVLTLGNGGMYSVRNTVPEIVSMIAQAEATCPKT
jgi:hypothetical protein